MYPTFWLFCIGTRTPPYPSSGDGSNKPLPAVVGNRSVLFLKHLNPNLKCQQKLNRISFRIVDEGIL
jgi:hypothetical protein